MPIDLPVRKSMDAGTPLVRVINTWTAALAAVCFTVALAEAVSMTPQTYRTGLTAAVYADMMLSP